MDTLKVGLNQNGELVDDVSVWEWSGSAYDQGLEASNWFTDFLGKPSRLVRFRHGVISFSFFTHPQKT